MRTFEEYKKLIDDKLLQYMPSIDVYAKQLKESMSYSLTVGGKRLRPVLLLAATDFAGGNLEEALPYACAIEYIHTYSLIHDDLPAMDNDTLRRGKPTNHVVYGEDMAILAGDGLLNSAAQIMYGELIKNLNDIGSASRHAKAGNVIMSRSGVQGMIAGQVVDVINEYETVNAGMVRYIEEHKTADLIIAPLLAGLHLSGADESVCKDFEIYGYNLGVAFQILDDILDIEGDQTLMGKTLGKDVEQFKCNYACVHGINAAKQQLHKLTNEAIKSISKYEDSADFFINLATSLETRNR